MLSKVSYVYASVQVHSTYSMLLEYNLKGRFFMLMIYHQDNLYIHACALV